MSTPMQIAGIDETAVSKIQALEKEYVAVIMAFEPGNQPAPLTEEQLSKLRDLEQELGVTLLAFDT